MEIRRQSTFHSIWACMCTLFVPLDALQPAIKLRGAGASFPSMVYKTWIPSFKAYRQAHVKLEMSYETVGSNTGKDFIKTKPDKYEYIGSDSLLSSEDKAKHKDLVMFPTMAGAVVVGYNLPGIKGLVLSRHHLVGIYNGTIHYWNDTSLRELNKNVEFPNKTITVLARADKSGTTSIFTGALSAFSEEWKHAYGEFSAGNDANEVRWDPSVIHLYAKRNRGMSGLLLSLTYSIGYLSIADAREVKLSYATLVNREGRHVNASTKTVQFAMDMRAKNSRNIEISLLDAPGAHSYPIAGYTYFIIKQTAMQDCNSAIELLRYVDWFLNDDEPRESCEKLNMVPLSTNVSEMVINMVIHKITCQGKNVWDLMIVKKSKEETSDSNWRLPVLVVVPMAILLVFIFGCYFAYDKIKFYRQLNKDEWNIPLEEIIFYYTAKSGSSGRTRFVMWPSVESLTSVDDIEDGHDMVKQILQWPGRWGVHTVGLRLQEVTGLQRVKQRTKALLVWLKDHVNHPNLVKFYGLTEVETGRHIVSEYCSKGPVTEILKDSKFNLTQAFKLSLATDIASGLAYMHSKNIVHGNLKTSSCLIDFKWTIKIADWEFCKLYTHLCVKKIAGLLHKSADEIGKQEAAFQTFWTAPEIVKSEFTVWSNPACDVYSFAIILQEIFTRKEPYDEYRDNLLPYDILKAVTSNNLRPRHGDDTPLNVRHIMELAWSADASDRPTSEQLVKMMRTSNSNRSVLDTMMEAMDEYAATLEEKIEQKDQELTEAREKMHNITNQLVPTAMIAKLQEGEVCCPQAVPSINVLCAKVCNLPDIQCADVRAALTLVQRIDEELSKLALELEIFKLDRGLGVYVFLCGLGVKEIQNGGQNHIQKVRNLITGILKITNNISIPGDACAKVLFQFGAHTDTVIASVINASIPKFYILGDAIDIAVIVMQASEPNKILASSSFHDIIQGHTFSWKRNPTDVIVGERKVETYWLDQWADPVVEESPSIDLVSDDADGATAEAVDTKDEQKTTATVECEFSDVKDDHNPLKVRFTGHHKSATVVDIESIKVWEEDEEEGVQL